MAVLPIKLMVLTVKTLAKPLASAFEARVMAIPKYRAFFIKIANALHRLDVVITRGAEGRTGKVFVGNIGDEEATKLASKVFSEGFLYVVASGLLMYELRVSAVDAAKKAEKQEEQQRAVNGRLSRIEEALEKMQGEWKSREAQHATELEHLKQNLSEAREGKTLQRRGWFGFAASPAFER